MRSPVTHPASSEARNTATRAISGSVASFHLGRIWSMIPLCDDSG
jgi:hypothetical protein